MPITLHIKKVLYQIYMTIDDQTGRSIIVDLS